MATKDRSDPRLKQFIRYAQTLILVLDHFSLGQFLLKSSSLSLFTASV